MLLIAARSFGPARCTWAAAYLQRVTWQRVPRPGEVIIHSAVLLEDRFYLPSKLTSFWRRVRAASCARLINSL